MCNVCAAIYAMTTGLEYDYNDKIYHILAIADIAEGPAKFQIRNDINSWKNKWIRTKNLADMMCEIGADIKIQFRTEKMKEKFGKYLKRLEIE